MHWVSFPQNIAIFQGIWLNVWIGNCRNISMNNNKINKKINSVSVSMNITPIILAVVVFSCFGKGSSLFAKLFGMLASLTWTIVWTWTTIAGLLVKPLTKPVGTVSLVWTGSRESWTVKSVRLWAKAWSRVLKSWTQSKKLVDTVEDRWNFFWASLSVCVWCRKLYCFFWS